jgi:hypothetical protein
MSKVCGEMVETMVRLQPMAGVPHKSPVPNMSRLSGEKGAISGVMK